MLVTGAECVVQLAVNKFHFLEHSHLIHTILARETKIYSL